MDSFSTYKLEISRDDRRYTLKLTEGGEEPVEYDIGDCPDISTAIEGSSVFVCHRERRRGYREDLIRQFRELVKEDPDILDRLKD